MLNLSTAASRGQSRIMVLVNKRLPGITVYNAETLEPLCHAKTEVAPHEVALSADGRHAYVPIYGSSGVGKPGTDGHLFHIFQTSDCKEVGLIDTGEYKRPHSIVVGQSGTVYLTAEIASAVIVIDPKEQRILGEIPTGSPTSHMIALNQDETILYCSNVQSKTVSVLDVKERRLAQTIETESENQRMTVSPDGRWFVTSLGPDKKIAFYTTADNQLDFEVPVDGIPFVSKFSLDGKYLFSAGHKNQCARAWKIDPLSRGVVALVDDLGGDVGSLEVNPFDNLVYVSDQPTNQITMLDPQSWTVAKTLATAASPDAMAFATVSS